MFRTPVKLSNADSVMRLVIVAPSPLARKMSMELSLSIFVNAPAADVFAVFADIQNAAGRIKDIKKIELLTPLPVGVGTKFKETRYMFGRQAAETFTISAFDPPVGYSLVCVASGLEMTTAFRFTQADLGTDVHISMTTRPINHFAKLLKPLGLLMQGTMRKCMEKDLASLKAFAERPKRESLT